MNLKGMTPQGKITIAVIVIAVLWGLKWVVVDSGYIPKSVKESKVIDIAYEDKAPLAIDKDANAPLVPLPGNEPTDLDGGIFRAGIMGWSAQDGILYANGAAFTTKGSLMEQQGIKLQLINQNNCNTQAEQLYAFAQDFKNNPGTTKGYHFIAWMGDGVPSYLAGLNEQIKKNLGDEYVAQVFFAGGLSYGEDKFLGRKSAKRDPQTLRGSLVVGVLRDGDWNIAMKYCDDNQIPVNNDPTTYDPNAVNWYAVDDYLKAVELYNNNQSETRPLVINGKRVGRDTTVSVDGVVTWTPGDANLVKGRGGLITLASTKDYSAQMPNTWIGIKKHLQTNRAKIKKFILASSLGGDQVKSHSQALTYASKVAEELYGVLTAQEWENYYRGIELTDGDGNIVEVGGSRVFNLADNALYFGLKGGINKYELVYNAFGQLAAESYPELYPNGMPAFQEIFDKSYLEEVYKENKDNAQMTVASVQNFKAGETISSVVSKKAVTIEFRTGSAEILPSSDKALRELLQSVGIADNLLVEISGHTDNQGNDELNLNLSDARAKAVKTWLVVYDPNFANRITAKGFGETRPVADNSTASGRQKNRRVEIKLGR